MHVNFIAITENVIRDAKNVSFTGDHQNKNLLASLVFYLTVCLTLDKITAKLYANDLKLKNVSRNPRTLKLIN